MVSLVGNRVYGSMLCQVDTAVTNQVKAIHIYQIFAKILFMDLYMAEYDDAISSYH